MPVAGNVAGDPHPGSWPDDLAVDDAGSIWFGEHHADQIGRMVPSGSGYVYQGYPVPTANSEMDCVIVDRTRNRVWAGESAGNKIALLDMNAANPQAVEYTVVTAGVTNPIPGDMALDPSGNPWFTSPYDTGGSAQAALGELNATTHQARYFPVPTPTTALDQIASDNAGGFWFAELLVNQIGHYTAAGQFTEYALPRPNVGPTNLAVGADGRVWVTEQSGEDVAVFDPADTTGHPWHEVAPPTPSSEPVGVCVDHAGNVWFTEFNSGKIGLIPAGTYSALDFPIPTPDSGPEDIEVAPSGGVFFSERYGNKIASITLTP